MHPNTPPVRYDKITLLYRNITGAKWLVERNFPSPRQFVGVAAGFISVRRCTEGKGNEVDTYLPELEESCPGALYSFRGRHGGLVHPRGAAECSATCQS